MSDTHDFLLEIGTEELPPKSLLALATHLSEQIYAGLAKAELPCGETQVFAAPRRLGVLIHDVTLQQSDRNVERRGPAVAQAYDDKGKPTPALQGFARSCGAELSDLEQEKTDKGAWVVFKQVQPGKSAAELLPDMIAQAANSLPIPKAMHWGAEESTFVRPVHWLLTLLGSEVLPLTLFAQTAGNKTYGHRFHSPSAITVKHPKDYESLLMTHYVLADFTKRRQRINEEIDKAAELLNARAVVPNALLDEVCGLVEWPVGLVAEFESDFLAVPPEALISSMQYHQKAFPLTNPKGELLPCFITISNIESQNPRMLVEGNEKVMRARLADAAFFFEQDKKQPLANRLEGLKNVIFQKKLGTLYDKSQRIARVATFIAEKLEADVALSERAALLAKCDLLTDMVGEFPELQGTIGYYYARHDGEAEAVADAVKEHYLPRVAGDELPSRVTSLCVALADRLDTLVGIFAVGKAPTGAQDPFGLRRAGLAIMRILIEKALPLDLEELLTQAQQAYGERLPEVVQGETLAFCFDRLRRYYTDQDIPVDTIQAVMVRQPTSPYDFHQRVLAVQQFRQLPEAETLAVANKRVSKLLSKQEDAVSQASPNEDLLHEPQEKALAKQVVAKQAQLVPLQENAAYTDILAALAELKQPIDDFFDHVMVMVEDDALRHNRLLILANLRALFLQVADISELQT